MDETCSKIDEIIAEAKASIDEYKELKQSVIFEAVTKGLDKNVEMKDSGNLAIGKIPKHWVKARVKNVATRITVGVVVTPANYFDDAGTVAFLRGINVKEYVINSEPMIYITEETNKELSKTIVHTNDLVIVRFFGSVTNIKTGWMMSGTWVDRPFRPAVVQSLVGHFAGRDTSFHIDINPDGSITWWGASIGNTPIATRGNGSYFIK